jgi:hypothetical protein
MAFKPRHKDCPSCKFFNPHRPSAKCVPCGAGEFFEEKDDDSELDDDELMALYAGQDYEHDHD